MNIYSCTINYCITFHTNNCKPISAPPCNDTFTHCWWECIVMQLVWKTLTSLKASSKIPLWLSNSAPTCIPSRNECVWPLNDTDKMFIAGLLLITKIWKQAKYPSTEELINCSIIYMVEFYTPKTNKQKANLPLHVTHGWISQTLWVKKGRHKKHISYDSSYVKFKSG